LLKKIFEFCLKICYNIRMVKKIIYLVVLILLSLCVIEGVRVAIAEAVVYPILYSLAEKQDNFRLYIKCGQIKIMAKKYDEAREDLTYVIENSVTSKDKRNKVLALYYLGNTFYEEEDYDEALTAYAAVLKLDPINKKALKKFSRIKMAMGEYVSLYPYISAYVREKPKDSFGWAERCAVLTRLDKFTAARQCCEKAIELRKSNARAHLDYAILLEKRGFKDLAKREYTEAYAYQKRIKTREELEDMLNIK